MSTSRKLNPKHRERGSELRHMERVFRMRYYTDSRGQFADLYLATHLALERLRKDPTRTGAAKARIYKQILDEYALNVAKFSGASAPIVPGTEARTEAVTPTTEPSERPADGDTVTGVPALSPRICCGVEQPCACTTECLPGICSLTADVGEAQAVAP